MFIGSSNSKHRVVKPVKSMLCGFFSRLLHYDCIFSLPCDKLQCADCWYTNTEVRNLIDWICVSEQIKMNNNRKNSVKSKIICMRKQNDFKGQKQKIEVLY